MATPINQNVSFNDLPNETINVPMSVSTPGTSHDITIIRHGSTQLNGENKIRGWADVPLSPEGERQARVLANSLKQNTPFNAIVTSDMKRAQQTAKIISDYTGVPIVQTTPAFRPWHVGELTRVEEPKARPILHDYIQNKPDQPLPGGESFNDFKDRALHGLQMATVQFPDKKLAIITHHRVERLVNAWDKLGQPEDHSIDHPTMLQKGVDPATAQGLTIKGLGLQDASRIPDQQIIQAIAKNESDSVKSSEKYTHVNPNSGDIGKYQVNPATLKTYAPRFLGKSVSPEEFRYNPALQEKFIANFVNYWRKIGYSPDRIMLMHRRGVGAELANYPQTQGYIDTGKTIYANQDILKN